MPIRPIPHHLGYGFTDTEPHPEYDGLGYRVEQFGRYHNWHFTDRNWSWPQRPQDARRYVVDGFSPNLNKDLHVGHLRNLMVASSLNRILPGVRMVAMLGAAVGIDEGALQRLEGWYNRAGYRPEIHLDVELPDVIPGEPGTGEFEGCRVWQGPKGPVVVKRSDGRPTYAHHDLCFEALVHPTHYCTGAEQKEHFEELGLGDRHLPMGLVLGPGGKKMSSREGTALSAEDALSMVEDCLKETPDPSTLAWNIMAWSFLRVGRNKNVVFDPIEWTNPDSPGLYAAYTLARLDSALGDLTVASVGIQDSDVPLLAACSYLDYYEQRAVETMDPAPIANYLHELAIKITSFYHAERIQGGRPGRQFAMRNAHATMIRAFYLLGLRPLMRV